MTKASPRHKMNHRDLLNLFRSSHYRCYFKKGVLKTFAYFTGKHLCWILFLITLRVFRPATLLKDTEELFVKISQYPQENTCVGVAFWTLWKRDWQVFFCEYCEIFKNTYFKKHPRTTGSEDTPTLMLSYEICEIFKNTFFEEHERKTASICFTSKYYNNEW